MSKRTKKKTRKVVRWVVLSSDRLEEEQAFRSKKRAYIFMRFSNRFLDSKLSGPFPVEIEVPA